MASFEQDSWLRQHKIQTLRQFDVTELWRASLGGKEKQANLVFQTSVQESTDRERIGVSELQA